MPRRKSVKKGNKTKRKIEEKVNKHIRDTVILFADIIGASEVSNHKPPEEYYKFVLEFQKIFKNVCQKYMEGWYSDDHEYHFSARGDEGILMIYPEKEPNYMAGVAVDVAVNIALALKRGWIQSEDNKIRIQKSQLLPVDVGIGIHLGRIWRNEDKVSIDEISNPLGIIPEGYSINLAKRIENLSRKGKYTNIFLSDSAHAAWRNLPDEKTYIFDEQQTIQPKGISRNIPVFEIKHHFLPTDWNDPPEERSQGNTLLDPKEVDPKLLLEARKLSPTNIWLSEECIRAIMLEKFFDLKENQQEDKDALKEAFSDARDIADDLANSELQDEGILLIQGFIEGESFYFESERKKYKQAIKSSPNLAEAYWYMGLSYSYEVDVVIKNDLTVTLDNLDSDYQKCVENSIKFFKAAHARSFQAAWITYDLGCELIRWAGDNDIQKNEGIHMIQLASGIFKKEVAEAIPDEPYLQGVLDDTRIKDLIKLGAKKD